MNSGAGLGPGREPAHIAGAVDAIINLLVAFHVIALTGDQIAQINAGVAAIFALIVRQSVTPMASPRLWIGTQMTTPAGAPAVVSGASPSQPRGQPARPSSSPAPRPRGESEPRPGRASPATQRT